MSFSRTRLDSFVRKELSLGKKEVRLLASAGRIIVDGVTSRSLNQTVSKFSKIIVNGVVLQDNKPRYVMLNKPKGVVCATIDSIHTTVIDLLPYPYKGELHIAGRLDLNSTGLVLLTNDSNWSKSLSSPESKVSKQYSVRLAKPLNDRYIEAFSAGMYFEYEDITLLPAKLEIISKYEAQVTLQEGRYHQIKRMFGQFRNQVLDLHRSSVGSFVLPDSLASGESIELSPCTTQSYHAKLV